MLEILNQYGLKCTFNLNSKRLLKNEDFNIEDAKLALAYGHEIAIHGAEHLAPCLVTIPAAVRDALVCREELENALGTIIRGMAYPDSGVLRFNNGSNYEEVKGYLKAIGIVYARSLGGDNDRFLLPEDWHAWMPTAHHNNPDLFDYIKKFLSLDLNKGWDSGNDPRLFYLWSHAFEFNDENMKNIKLCMGVGPSFSINVSEQIRIPKKCGFADWQRIAKQLKEFNFTNVLCFEVRNTYY